MLFVASTRPAGVMVAARPPLGRTRRRERRHLAAKISSVENKAEKVEKVNLYQREALLEWNSRVSATLSKVK